MSNANLPELLAPAGGYDSLRAAVQSGADAVYIGGPFLNARRTAENFTTEKIVQAADYCHLYGVKLHVAVNTLIKDTEFAGLKNYVYDLNDAGVDALIIQDIGAAMHIKKLLPDMPLHASTQMTVTSAEGAEALADIGFSRVILARELSREEISYICAHTNAETEVFCHGAICECYSGQCLMSSIIGGRSGNRGCCAQPCRLPYTIVKETGDEESGYELSPKDMMLVDHLSELSDIGVRSLKIEGRLKRAEYVSAVTGVYRRCLDSGNVNAKDIEELKNAFCRGFTDGYFTGKTGRDMMSREDPSNKAGNIFTAEAKARAAENANIRKIAVTITALLRKDEPIEITFSDEDGNYASARGQVKIQQAQNNPTDEERIGSQLASLGNTPFRADNVYVTCDDNIYIPIKEINSVRREAADKLASMRTTRKKGHKIDHEVNLGQRERSAGFTIAADVSDISQAKTAIECGSKMIYVPYKIYADVEKIAKNNITVIAKADAIFTKADIENENIMVQSAADINYYGAKENKKLYGGMRLNIFNASSVEAFADLERVLLSPELNLHEIADITSRTNSLCDVIAYGRLPLMITKNCPLKAAGKCQHGKAIRKLRDRKNKEFPVMCLNGCVAEILNSEPLYTADKINDIKNSGVSGIRLLFTTESKEECRKIINEYMSAANGNNIDKPKDNTFTRGHFYRGVV